VGVGTDAAVFLLFCLFGNIVWNCVQYLNYRSHYLALSRQRLPQPDEGEVDHEVIAMVSWADV